MSSSGSVASQEQSSPVQPGAPPPPPPGPSAYTRAPKGKACLNCRRRKLKCDCARPVCSQCTRFGRERDCEYSDRDQRSRTEVLEERVAVLQARLRELEHPEEAASSSSLRLNAPETWMDGPGDVGDLDMTDHGGLYSSGAGSSSDPSMVSYSPTAELTLPMAQSLIEAFLPFATDVGFFLNTTRFLSWASQHLPSHSPYLGSDESDPLLSAVYLWGTMFTLDPDLRGLSEVYLARAVQRISAAYRPVNSRLDAPFNVGFGYSEESPPNTVYLIQAEVLLANFVYSAGRFVEGRRHTANAVTLVLSFNLHKLRLKSSSRGSPPDTSKMRLVPCAEAAMMLPPPADLVEEGERISAFWQVYILDKTWSRLMDMNSLLADDGSPSTRIDTPWPLTMEQYVEGTLPHEYGNSYRTIERFVADIQSARLGPKIPALAFRAQAAMLLDKAAWLSSVCAPDPSLLRAHQAEFESTDALIENFILSLPPLSSLLTASPPPSAELVRSLIVTHSLVRVAVVQLHVAYANETVKSAAKCLSACKAIIGAISCVPASQLNVVDPLILILLTSAAQVIIAELVRVKDIPVYTRPVRPVQSCMNPQYLARAMGEVVSLMSCMNRGSRLTALQLETVRNSRSVLAGTEFA